MFNLLDNIDRKLRDRVERVAFIAANTGDNAIVQWAVRAANDAIVLGKLRDKDNATLARLEDTYGHEFYRNSNGANPIHA